MRTLALVMAGGQGTRLHPLTRDRAKPAVPFGGKYRIIDFVLSNLVNSGIYAIYVLVQWRSQSLIEHLKDGWQFGGMLPDHFVIPVPAQMRMGELWYQGTADAIFQNLNLIDDTKPDLVAVFGADHIYRMDIQQMIEFHMERKAAVTVATLPVNVDEANQFGIVQVDSGLRVSGFVEKPDNPPQMPGAPGRSLASMGNYLFSVQSRSAARGADRRFDQREEQSRFRPRPDSRADQPGAGVRVQLHDQSDPRRLRGQSQLLARCRDARRVLRGQHGPARRAPAFESIQCVLAAADCVLRSAAGEVRVR